MPNNMLIANADAFFDDDFVHLTLTLGKDNADNIKMFLENFPFDQYEVTIKKRRKKKRSISINAYFWVLLDQIAAMLHTTKEELYKDVVRADGVFTVAEMKSEAFPRFRALWTKNGLGWWCEKISEMNGRAEVACYYGTSAYDASEMNRIVDKVVEDAKQCGIETATPKEIERMKKIWADRINDALERETLCES